MSNDSYLKRLNFLVILTMLQLIFIVVILFEVRSDKRHQNTSDVTAKQKTSQTETKPSTSLGEEQVAKKQEVVSSRIMPTVPSIEKPIKVEGLRIEVLNGCGVDGIARKTSNWLKKRGYQVADVRNADHNNYSQTRLVDRKDNRTLAKQIILELGMDESAIDRSNAPNTANIDFTIIIGSDYKRFNFAN